MDGWAGCGHDTDDRVKTLGTRETYWRATTHAATAAARSTGGGVVIRRLRMPPDDADVAAMAADEASFSFKEHTRCYSSMNYVLSGAGTAHVMVTRAVSGRTDSNQSDT